MSETPQDTKCLERTRRNQNGAAIRSLREKDGYSQNGLAEAAGLTQANLSLIESERRNARVATLNKIARALRVPVAAIMREIDDVNGSAA